MFNRGDIQDLIALRTPLLLQTTRVVIALLAYYRLAPYLFDFALA
jgi:hypothetical protein